MLTQVSKAKETLEAERKRIKEELRAQVIAPQQRLHIALIAP